MDTQTIDQEYGKLQTAFQGVAQTVQGLAEKMQAAEKAGNGNATEWLADLKQIAEDISSEQTQANALLQAIHGFIGNIAQAQGDASSQKPPLYAPGQEPQEEQQQGNQQRGGMFGGGMMGGPMMGGYFGGGFARAMEMGAGIGLGQTLIGSIFRL
jgi:hypothetical protein